MDHDALDPDDCRPLFEQIADRIRQRILSGELGPGDRVPSRTALARTYQVASMTAYGALRVLRQEGLTVARPGHGTFVRTNPTGGRP